MKKVLLAGTALLGLAAFSAPAAAEVNLDIGGFFRGYGVFADNDETDTAAPGDELRDFDFRRDTEIHFSGETTTDNGLTLGFHYELDMGAEGSQIDINGDGDFLDAGEITAGGNTTDEAYMYVSSGWGRFNFGSEDGAAYLLQVAAPSADSNVDGMRVYIQALNFVGDLGYDHADFGNTDRLTYLTPKWNGFQAGLSYAPEVGQNAIGNNVAGMAFSDNLNDFEDLWEAAARWDGEFEGFGISFGAGYSDSDVEANTAGAIPVGEVADGIETWNVGLNVAFNGFSVGSVYTETSTEAGDGAPAGDVETEVQTWVVGLGYDNGPYHLGATYLDRDTEIGAADLEVERFAVGAGYTYGPGATFRGAVAFGDTDDGVAGTADPDFTQVTIGTDVQF